MPTHAALPDSSYSSVASVDEVPIKWYERPSQWHTVADLSELEETLRNSDGKYVAVEFFAGWCSSCKSAYPALCRIPNDENIAAKFMFVKANIEDSAITQYIKQLSIKGIPHLAVFHPDGHFMLGMTSSFSRMAQVRTNLAVIAGNPGAKDFVADPNGFVVPRF